MAAVIAAATTMTVAITSDVEPGLVAMETIAPVLTAHQVGLVTTAVAVLAALVLHAPLELIKLTMDVLLVFLGNLYFDTYL